MARSTVYAVIMAGGSGTRFWPLSRATRPKQFLPLATSRPLIADTLGRLAGLAPPARTLVVCGARHAALVKKALPSLPGANVVVEPDARNTAPAIALATAQVARRDEDAVVVVLPSDQHVGNVRAFKAALRTAVDAARTGHIVTLGITPTRPETGYGYIRMGAPAVAGARAVEAFVEKPDAPTAQRYLTTGGYVWNAGIFVFQVGTMLHAFETLMPELWAPLAKVREVLAARRPSPARLAAAWRNMPKVSIDYGVAEKAPNMLVVPCDCAWSDVGSFAALPEVRKADGAGNVVSGDEVVVVDSSGCVVSAGKRVVAVVGVKDLVVVDTPDAVLVVPRDRSQDVRKVVDLLAARKRADVL